MRGETGTWDRPEMPDGRGRFGNYGGAFVPEVLVTPLHEITESYEQARLSADFLGELEEELHSFAGRPTPLALAERLTRSLGGARILLKREDLLHTGSNRINAAIGQVLLAKRMGKTRVVTATCTGRQGVATALAAARYGLGCTIYTGTRDAERHGSSLRRARLAGAEVRLVSDGRGGLPEALDELLRDWAGSARTTFFVASSVVGPHPYPRLVRDFQSVIGSEARQQCLEAHDRLPDMIVAAVGGGSHAIGLFYPFLHDDMVSMIGVEAGGLGTSTGRHAARFAGGTLGVFHGCKTLIIQEGDGQLRETHSIADGLLYPAVGPEHALLQEVGRARYDTATDEEALDAFHRLASLEGILPGLDSCHALAWAVRSAPRMPKIKHVLVCVSGRGEPEALRDEEEPEP